jgi:hypothetical protein
MSPSGAGSHYLICWQHLHKAFCAPNLTLIHLYQAGGTCFHGVLESVDMWKVLNDFRKLNELCMQ